MASAMTTSPTLPTGEVVRSEFACVFCKRFGLSPRTRKTLRLDSAKLNRSKKDLLTVLHRRKVKCDRSLPFCTMCTRSRQMCEYPVEAGRPGPKIGSTRGRRKRARSRSLEPRGARNAVETRSHTPERRQVDGGEERSRAPKTNVASSPGLTGSESISVWRSTASADNYPPTPASTPLDVHTLAYIVHPSHETASIATPVEEPLDMRLADQPNASGTAFVTHACSLLSISVEAMQTYIKLYFENMTSFSLFHQPTFESKFKGMKSPRELAGLLATMFSFASRFKPSSDQVHDSQNQHIDSQELYHSPSYFQSLAQKYVDEELLEYSDKPPTLCLLQALLLLTFQQLTTGVRGAAWRHLGLCIRVAYELQLHQIDVHDDAETDDVGAWCAVEERRRVWWAIWEMDAFASTIKRCPSGIDRDDNETRLPAPDEYWYQGRMFRSCFLESKPMDRVTALRESGNESEKAWFLLLNSFMYDGHILSKYRSARPGNGRHGPSKGSLKKAVKDVSESLLILANALKCFSLALPKALRYRDEFLSFSSRDLEETVSMRRVHSAKYSIHVMTQLTRIMIHHHDAYGGAVQDLQLPDSSNEQRINLANTRTAAVSLHIGPTRKGLQQYLDAADEILSVVSRSSEDHIRYVNPFLASTIWYGAAIHLSWKVLAPSNLNQEVMYSKYEVLRLIFEEYTAFWNLPTALQENLQSMEEKLRKFTSGNRGAAVSRYQNQTRVNNRPGSSNQQTRFPPKPLGPDSDPVPGDDSRLQNQRRPNEGSEQSPSTIVVAPWQTPPRSRDAFYMDGLVSTDSVAHTEMPYLVAANLWSDLELDFGFDIGAQDYQGGLGGFNYTEM